MARGITDKGCGTRAHSKCRKNVSQIIVVYVLNRGQCTNVGEVYKIYYYILQV